MKTKAKKPVALGKLSTLSELNQNQWFYFLGSGNRCQYLAKLPNGDHAYQDHEKKVVRSTIDQKISFHPFRS